MGYTASGGPKGLGVFTNTPQTVADLNKLVELIARMGNYRGPVTTAERDAITGTALYEGLLVYNTTTDQLEVYSGSGWVLVWKYDTGWQPITLNPGWSAYLGETPRYRVKNGMLQLAGRASASAGATVELGVLPAIARHTSTLMVFRLHYDNGVAGVTVDSGGLVAVFEPGSAASRPGISLAQVQYLVG